MPKNAQESIRKNSWDIEWKYGKPWMAKPFHRIYHLDWQEDGKLRYWTHGYREWIVTDVTRQSIDDFYMVVAHQIDKSNHMGPRPATDNVDGSSSYSPCNYCEFNSTCEQFEHRTPEEFKDAARKVAVDKWKERE